MHLNRVPLQKEHVIMVKDNVPWSSIVWGNKEIKIGDIKLDGKRLIRLMLIQILQKLVNLQRLIYSQLFYLFISDK